jgi:thiosulfate dehydrogenase [quinone] large subunit
MQRYDLSVSESHQRIVRSPHVATTLFDTPRFALLWLAARVYLGWSWLDAGQSRLHDPLWMSGETLHATWAWGGHSLGYAWLAAALAVGQTLLGIALILGLFVGVSAFAGSLLSCRPILAGSAAIDPVAFVVALGLVLAWKTAGWIGLDRWVLPLAFSRRATRPTRDGAAGRWQLKPTTAGPRDAPG